MEDRASRAVLLSSVFLYVIGSALLALAILLAVLCHPAIFYGGRPLPMPMGAFADLFFFGQWLAFGLTAGSLGLFALVWKWRPAILTPFPQKMWAGPILAGLLLLYLLMAGVPHKANRSFWYKGKLGLIEFVRGVAKE
jgi:hypothetical protein